MEIAREIAGGVESDGYVPFWQTGVSAKGEFQCSECGYGVIVSRQLPPCPMCGGESWEQSAWAPFARAPELRAG
jgi:rubrerythrin